MGKLAVYKYFSMMFLVAQIIATVFTIVALYGGDVSPIGHSARAMLVYVLPLLIAINVLLAVYWLIRRRWLFLLMPIATIACCIPYRKLLKLFLTLVGKIFKILCKINHLRVLFVTVHGIFILKRV